MPAQNNRVSKLLYKFLHHDINDEEMKELNAWLNESSEHKRLFEELTGKESLQQEIEEYKRSKNKVWDKISKGIAEEKVLSIRHTSIWRRVSVASVILVIVSAGVYLGLNNNNKPSEKAERQAALPLLLNEVAAPSSNQAVIITSDGRQIPLSNVENGTTLATEATAKISKLEDGRIVYNAIAATDEIRYNTINNPKGSKPVSLVLSDGSMVWLNTASSITYPVSFTGNSKERVVSMTGEAYFEIVKNESMPFRVNAAGKGEIIVLGTHFNVNAYNDEGVLNTTLLEGSVKVTHKLTGRSILIKPGQQARLHPSGGLSVVDDVDTNEVTAWRTGFFKFRSADVSTILRQAARWYDLQIEYEGPKPTDRFSGGFSKNVNLEEFLSILNMSELRCRVTEDRKLIVTAK